MSAQEELEKVAQELRLSAEIIFEHFGSGTESRKLCELADRIAAIREGFGKAQEPVRWMCPDHGDVSRVQRVGWLPLYTTTPTDSAQVLVDALERIANPAHSCRNCRTRYNMDEYPCHSCRIGEKIEKFDDLWSPQEQTEIAREALAAHKSEVKG